MRQIIYLDQKDNIATIREKLEHIQAQEAVLVIPPRYRELQSLVNLRLLKRYAEHLAIDLALVVRDAPTRTLAKEVGFVLTSNVDKGRRIEIKGGKRAKGAQPAAVAGTSPAPQPGISYAPRSRAGAISRLLALLVLVVLLGAMAGGFIYFVLPSATITLTPAAELLDAQMEITGVPGLETIDYGTGRIPARVVSVELEGTANTPTTGQRDIPDAHAEGMVVFANKTSSPVTVPKGTIVRTGTGTPIRFYTVTDLELPGERGAHARIGIIAVDAGLRGNVKQLTINDVEGDISFQVDVINDEPTSGGGLKRVNEVSAEDLGRVKNALLQRLHQEAMTKLQSQLAETEFIPAESISVEATAETYDKAVGEVADNLNLRLQVVATGMVVGGEEANTLLLGMLQSKLPAGYALDPESVRFQQPQPITSTSEEIRFSMSASAVAVSDVNAADVRRELAGRSVADAYDYLTERWAFAEDPEVIVSPEWIGRVPWIPYRVQVTINTLPAS